MKCKCWTKELEEPGWELALAQKGALKAEGVQNTPPGGCRSLSTSQHPPETISAPSPSAGAAALPGDLTESQES